MSRCDFTKLERVDGSGILSHIFKRAGLVRQGRALSGTTAKLNTDLIYAVAKYGKHSATAAKQPLTDLQLYRYRLLISTARARPSHTHTHTRSSIALWIERDRPTGCALGYSEIQRKGDDDILHLLSFCPPYRMISLNPGTQ